jgi:biopolymer transport protein ExbD
MSRVYRRGPAAINANLTPMIDMTFLLIVFFVLVSRIVDVENVPMNLPVPEKPLSEKPSDEQRMVINVVPGPAGTATGYRIGGRGFDVGPQTYDAMVSHIASLYRGNPAQMVNLRADRETSYEWIEPALRAVSEAARASGVPAIDARINLVIQREE